MDRTNNFSNGQRRTDPFRTGGHLVSVAHDPVLEHFGPLDIGMVQQIDPDLSPESTQEVFASGEFIKGLPPTQRQRNFDTVLLDVLVPYRVFPFFSRPLKFRLVNACVKLILTGHHLDSVNLSRPQWVNRRS